MVKSIDAPHLGRPVKLGRSRPVAMGPHFRLSRYLRATLPSPPTMTDYTTKAASVIEQVFLNDQLGDCVCAGGYHIVGVETGNAGDLFTATNDQVQSDYEAIGGYVPGNPATDNGCDEVTALNYWTQHGFANGTKLLGWLAVDATNKTEVMQALYLFENLMFGIELPDGWISPFPSATGFTWAVQGAPNPENGHCVVGVGYDTVGVKIATWGMTGTITWDAVAEYCVQKSGGMLYVMLTPDQALKGAAKAGNGLAWADLISDFDTMGGNVPAPTPSVPPSPSSAVVTLTDAQAWTSAALAGGPILLTRSLASRLASQALAARWPKP